MPPKRAAEKAQAKKKAQQKKAIAGWQSFKQSSSKSYVLEQCEDSTALLECEKFLRARLWESGPVAQEETVERFCRGRSSHKGISPTYKIEQLVAASEGLFTEQRLWQLHKRGPDCLSRLFEFVERIDSGANIAETMDRRVPVYTNIFLDMHVFYGKLLKELAPIIMEALCQDPLDIVDKFRDSMWPWNFTGHFSLTWPQDVEIDDETLALGMKHIGGQEVPGAKNK